MARLEPRTQVNFNDFKVEIPELEGKLDPKEFLDWMHTVEQFLNTRMFQKTRR